MFHSDRQRSWQTLAGGRHSGSPDWRLLAKPWCPSALDLLEDDFIPFRVGQHSEMLDHEGTAEDAERLLRGAKEIISQQRLALVNYGWNRSGLVLNFRTSKDQALFRLFYCHEGQDIS